jgi:hypothetical protein
MQAQLLRKTPLAMAIAALGLVAANPAAAFKFETENGLQGSFDSTISVGVTQRLKSPDNSIIGNDSGGKVPTSGQLGELVNGAGNGWTSNPDFNYTNVDDGDQNYKKGQVVSSVLKGTHEFFLKRQGDWAGLARFTWSSDFSSPDTQRTPLDPEAKRAVERNISLLDLWVSKEVSFGDNPAKIKVGNQVISWGEDIFFMGGVNTINAIDIRKAHIPGAQLKELFIPAPMISLATSLGTGLSAEAYYQVRWNKFIFDPSGTYWSGADFIGKGGKRGAFIPSSLFGLAPGTYGDFDPTRGRTLAFLNDPTTPQAAQLGSIFLADGGVAPGFLPVEIRTPKNTGQYGLNLRFKPKDADTEYAAYYIRYHDKLPFVGFKQDLTGNGPNVAGYTAIEQYGEDKELFGVSLNTKFGEWAVGAELSYRPRDSVAIDPTVPLAIGSNAKPQFNLAALATQAALTGGTATVNGYTEEKKWQAHLTGFKMLGPAIPQALGAAEGYVMTELTATYYPNLDLSGAVPYLLNNYTLPDRRSWGYVVEGGLTYANIFQSGWTMSPIIDWYHHVKGTSPNTIPFIQGYRAVSVGLNFDLHNVWKVGFNYSTFFGGGNLNLMRDRDVISASASYTF